MSTRLKSTILLIVTLGLGMVLGALVNARLADTRIERIGELRSAQGFVGMMERTIEPVDAEQGEAVRAILEATREQVRAQNNAHRRAIRAIFREARQDLEQVLTPEQLQRLEEQRLLRRRERGDGPPGRRPPRIPREERRTPADSSFTPPATQR